MKSSYVIKGKWLSRVKQNRLGRMRSSKGQKHKSYPPELKAAILKENEAGYGWKALARMHPEINGSTIHGWVTKHNKGADVTVDRRKGCVGRKKAGGPTAEDYKERYEILKKYQAFLEARQGRK